MGQHWGSRRYQSVLEGCRGERSRLGLTFPKLLCWAIRCSQNSDRDAREYSKKIQFTTFLISYPSPSGAALEVRVQLSRDFLLAPKMTAILHLPDILMLALTS